MPEINEQMAAKEYPREQRLQNAAGRALLIAWLFDWAWLGAQFTLHHPNAALWLRASGLLLSALLVAGPVYLVVVALRRKSKTGRFFLTRAEREAQLDRTRRKIGAGKPFWPQATYWIPLAVLMAICCALAPLCVIGAVRFCSSPGDLPLGIPLAVLAGLLLFILGRAVYVMLRRKQESGSYLPSGEELERTRAKSRTPQSLRQRVLLAAILNINAFVFTAVAISNNHAQRWYSRELWFLVAMLWYCAILWTWQAFRPSVCAPPDALDPDRPPSVVPR